MQTFGARNMWTLRIYNTNGTTKGIFSFSNEKKLKAWIDSHIQCAKTKWNNDENMCELYMTEDSIRKL